MSQLVAAVFVGAYTLGAIYVIAVVVKDIRQEIRRRQW